MFKKLLFPVFGLWIFGFQWTAPAAAAVGDRAVSIGAGLAFPGDDLGDSVDVGLNLQSQYLAGIHPILDVGGQLDLIIFGEDDRTVNGTKIETDVTAMTAQAIAKLHPANPGSAIPYGIFGFGLGLTSVDTSINGALPGVVDADDEEIGFTFSIGGGVDFDLGGGREAGISLRAQDIDVDGISDATFISLMGHYKWAVR